MLGDCSPLASPLGRGGLNEFFLRISIFPSQTKGARIFFKKSFNPPPPRGLAQGDQSPSTHPPSPGRSIPQNLTRKARNLKKKSFSPPPPRGLAQGDQSPSTHHPSPGGSIPQNSVWKSQICRKDKIQSPSTQPSSPGGSIPLNP